MKRKIIIFTDLDGSLLDHNTYSFEAAKPALELIQYYNIPLILNSSKTLAELHEFRLKLGINDPIIAENGGVIGIPIRNIRGTPQVNGAAYISENYTIEHTSKTYNFILKTLTQLRQKHTYRFTGFSEMSLDDIIKHTGLTRTDAILAKERNATEPLLWEDSESRLIQFSRELSAHSLSLTKGGRFYHVMGDSSKGKGVKKIIDHYAYRDAPLTIALGDGLNDISMLECVEYPVVIPGHDGTVLEIRHEKPYTARDPGPQGWNDTLLQVLGEIGII